MTKIGAVCMPLLLVFGVACARVPEIGETQIRFVGGKVLQYHPHRILHARPEDALKKGEPVALAEKPVLVPAWARLVLIRVATLYEGETQEVSVYDYKGDLLNSPKKIVGTVFLLDKVNRILLAQQSAHYLVTESYLLDGNGALVRLVPQPQNVSSFGFSDDQEMIWFVSSRIEAGRAVGQVTVIDTDGNRLAELSFYEAKTIDVRHKGRSYTIKVEAPQIPG